MLLRLENLFRLEQEDWGLNGPKLYMYQDTLHP